MLNVHDYVNANNCLTSVCAEYKPFSGDLVPHPYLVNGDYFDVSLNGKSNDKHHLSFPELVELLRDPARYPSARVRCKPNRPGTTPNGRRVLSKLNWEPLRRQLAEQGLIPDAKDQQDDSGQKTVPTGEAQEPPAPTTEGDYRIDPERLDARKQAHLKQAIRPGQQGFRQRLIALSGGAVCAISGCRIASLVQAAHLMPYLGEADNHPANGLLLRADLHLLFDRGRLGIDPATRQIHLHPEVASDPHYAPYQGAQLDTPHHLSEPALQVRWSWYRDAVAS
ncbi:HNH endonuclease [Thiorhodococcus minor]|uniref:HNH nuclease domain-containing protein n=1 Tax=Thiorhodococcus minor TaxID=57489 RepID=A0A6M0K7W9_9GAMM|nr:HNH endonuclease [Thiorhodococcus minor]NEV65053.1 hypothetical protein [Thiorhodococcus minor]